MAALSAFLNVSSLQQSLAFYQGLGFAPTYVSQSRAGVDTYAGLSFEGAEIELGWIGSNDDPEYRAWVGTPLGAGVVLYLTVRDVDKLAAKAKAIGATVEYGPEERSYGRVLGLNDPDGYVLTFLQEPRKPAAKRRPAPRPRKAAKKAAKKAGRKGRGR
jgi:predicted enzyme related to lactoylglutathione lyase